MPSFSARSLEELATCDERLQRVMNEVVKYRDCVILDGSRTKEEQDKAFETGKSKLRWPQGKHCSSPSLAVDAAPYPVDWNNRDRFLLFAGFVLGVGRSLGIPLRYGGDWGGDGDPKNDSFQDLVHFELTT